MRRHRIPGKVPAPSMKCLVSHRLIVHGRTARREEVRGSGNHCYTSFLRPNSTTGGRRRQEGNTAPRRSGIARGEEVSETHIHEAIAATTPREPYITRKSWGYTFGSGAPRGTAVKLLPTDSPDLCIVLSGQCDTRRGWSPSREDLIADDWTTADFRKTF